MLDSVQSSMYQKVNLIRRQAAYRLWHRRKSQRYILRTQLGFDRLEESRPQTCIDCIHYHGKSYGQSLAKRTILICGFHPLGWSQSASCPDWQGNT